VEGSSIRAQVALWHVSDFQCLGWLWCFFFFFHCNTSLGVGGGYCWHSLGIVHSLKGRRYLVIFLVSSPPSSASHVHLSYHLHISTGRLPTSDPTSYAACAPSHAHNTQTPKHPAQTLSRRLHAAHPYTQVQPSPSTPPVACQIHLASPSASE